MSSVPRRKVSGVSSRLHSVTLRARLIIVAALSVVTALAIAGITTSRAADPASSTTASNKSQQTNLQQKNLDEPADIAAFRQSVGGEIVPVIVELNDEPGVLKKVAAERQGHTMRVEEIGAYSEQLYAKQNEFYTSLGARGVRALLREADVKQIDGSMRHVEYRFTYLLNGFVAYVVPEEIARLRALPEVAAVSEIQPTQFFLDKAIDYSLGTQPNPADRRTAVYGANQEFTPATTDPAHPETPRTTKIDGYEGQNINIAIIDSGVDYRHPMFGGTGLTTPAPRVSGQAESPADNKKVIYYYALSSPGDPTDDFGHGTLVASTAAGYAVDGSTPRRTGYGTGVNNPDGTPGTGVGPTPNGAQLFGSAPQAKIMAYKVCGPAPQCPGDIPLAMEDAASPVTLVGRGDGGATPTAVPKPVADVINLSLGDTSGDPSAPSARAANNAALAGTIVVASAGNSGPGAGTIGSPSAGTLVVSVAASLDPGSVSGADVLRADQVPLRLGNPTTNPPTVARGDTCSQSTRTEPCNTPVPPTAEEEEIGSSSNANQLETGPRGRAGIRIFPVAGGGALPTERTPGEPSAPNDGSISAHYTFLNRGSAPATEPVPAAFANSIRNRIVIVKFTGAFAAAANQIAVFNPAAIILLTSVESATAVQVVNGTPTFTMSVADGEFLLDQLSSSTADDGADADPAQGAVSELPLRLAESVTLAGFQGVMAGFSSRGPNDHPNARFRTIKPDVTAPGVGIQGAATVEGLPDDTIGLASATGYTQANGTSFSGPITAGAIVLIRQRVREELGLDTTNLNDAQYRAKRFDTVTVSRALLMNSATNLRSGIGVPQGDGADSVASINDMGAGHINIAGALQAKAIMVAPTILQTTPREFTPRPSPSPVASPTPFPVLIPSVSYGAVPVAGVSAVVTRVREVIVRDVTNGAGGGTYNLSVQNNRNLTAAGVQVSIVGAADSTTPITSINVPAGGQASYFVRIAVDGGQTNIIDGTEFQWYVSATHAVNNQRLRMPFYYRAIAAALPINAAPNQQPIEGTEQPSPTPTPSCPGDTDGSYRLRWTYTTPSGGKAPDGFRVQEATTVTERFFDNADEPLVGGANSKWTGSAQWTSQTNPNTGSLAYFIPDAAMQNESLVMKTAVALPAGGATLSFTTTQDTEEAFDYAYVDISTDGGTNFVNVATYTGRFTGTRNIDLTPFTGNSVKIRFRFTSDLANDQAVVGWYVEDIRLSSDNFRKIADTAAGVTSLDITGRGNGTYIYRIAGLFMTAEGLAAGPYSNTRCVTVNIPNSASSVQFSAATYSVAENGGQATITVTRTGSTSGAATVAYQTANGTATAPADYVAASGTLSFAANETSKTFTITIVDDQAVEGDETVNLTLSNPTGGATLGTPNTAVLTITDNDQTPPTPPTISINDSTVAEGNTGTTNATFTVSLSAASAQQVTVAYATADGTAAAGSDYQAATGTLTFAANETSKTINVAVNGDTTVESDETFSVNLSNPTNATIADGQGTGTITNDDQTPPPPTPTISINDASAAEGNSGTSNLTFTVTLSAASTQSVTVAYATTDGSAAAPGDYVASSGTLTFAAGETTKPVTVTINGDTTVEPDETFTVNLTNPTNATIADGQGTGTITNDDIAPQPSGFEFDRATQTVAEGEISVTLTVRRTGNTTGEATVRYANGEGALIGCDIINGRASERCDYSTTVGVLRFAAGETSKTIVTFLTDDVYVEGNETATFTLSDPTNGTQLNQTSSLVLTITDNDTDPNAANPINIDDFFVRRHYIDFLRRYPAQVEVDAWLRALRDCPQGDTRCDRIEVSSAFYRSDEFQFKGFFAYRFYKVSFGRKPVYKELMEDIERITAATPEEVTQRKEAFTNEFVQREDFRRRYDSLSNRAYVEELERTAGVPVQNKEQLISDLDNGRKTRAQVLREIVESNGVFNKEFPEAFVVMEYFGYLRRDGTEEEYNRWLPFIRQNPNDYRAMVNGFVNSIEYRKRFGNPQR